MVERKFNHVGDFVNGVKMRQKMIVKDFDVFLTIVINDGGDGFKRIEDTSNDNEIGVEILKWRNNELIVFYLIIEVFEVNKLKMVIHLFGFLLKALIFNERGKSSDKSYLHKLYSTCFGFSSGGLF